MRHRSEHEACSATLAPDLRGDHKTPDWLTLVVPASRSPAPDAPYFIAPRTAPSSAATETGAFAWVDRMPA
ncbi:MAG: hypothetical protein MUF54_12580, partial [Polyangiaceae bacterium]|nr:hypothetical protein [Polyangiaceae bacterium]